MRICIFGAGAMGCLYGVHLQRAGYDVQLVDRWVPHVEAINRDGLLLDGIGGELRSFAPATSDPASVRDIDLVIMLVDANSTRAAAAQAADMLSPKGYVLTLQNGVGNLEAMDDVLGRERVMGGLSYHSAALTGPGHATHTYGGPTWIGDRSGLSSTRVAELFEIFERAGMSPQEVNDIETFILDKWIINSSINAICAITGFRQGEIPRTPALDEFQDRILDEALAVLAAKKIPIDTAELRTRIKDMCRKKFNKPSMLQHIEAGKETEIEALNGAIVREGQALGIATPYNHALTLLIKGLEKSRAQMMHGPHIDYDQMEINAR